MRLVRYLVQSGHNPNACDAMYQTPLLHAVKAGSASTVSYLLEAGANAIVEDPLQGGTPLHWATLGGSLEVLEVLLKTPGVSVHCRASGSGTSSRWLESRQLTHILVQGGQSVDRVLRYSAGGTPLHWAARAGQVAVARALVKAGARVGDLDGEGAGVLHWGVLSGKKEIIALLVKAGARDVPDLHGESAADLAAVAAGWAGFGEMEGVLKSRRDWLRGLFWWWGQLSILEIVASIIFAIVSWCAPGEYWFIF